MRLINSYLSFFSGQHYCIGFLDSDYCRNSYLSRGIVWLEEMCTDGNWYADPFILSVSPTLVEILVEEYSVRESKGSICKLSISRSERCNYSLLSKKTLLRDNTHYSFPYIFHEGNRVFVCPENYQSGGVYLYEYDNNNEELINKTLIIDRALVDTQLFFIDGRYYAFGVETQTGRLSESRTLRVFTSKSLYGPFVECQSIMNKKNEERGAGTIYYDGSRIIRPAQCSEGRYGKEIILYELIYQGGVFAEKEIHRYKQHFFDRNGLSIHTINTQEDITVVDGLEYNNCPFVSRIINPINRFFLALMFKKYRK